METVYKYEIFLIKEARVVAAAHNWQEIFHLSEVFEY